MKTILALLLFALVLFCFSFAPLSAQEPIGTGAPTRVSPSPTPVVTATPKPIAPVASDSQLASGQKSDAEKALEIGQVMLSDQSFAEKVLRIFVVLHDGKLAGGDLGEVLNSWSVAALTGIRDGAGGFMFPDFLADTGINKLAFAISLVMFGVVILAFGWRAVPTIKRILNGTFNGQLEAMYFVGLILFVSFLLFQPSIYKLLADVSKGIVWWIAQQSAVALRPGEDPFTFLVTTVLTLTKSAVGFGSNKTLGQLILPPALASLALFLLANTIWLLLLTTFGQVGMGFVFISGNRALSGFFIIFLEIALTFYNAGIVFTGILTLIIIATSQAPMAEPLLILGVGSFILLFFAIISNLFLRLMITFPIFKRLKAFEDGFGVQDQMAVAEVDLAEAPSAYGLEELGLVEVSETDDKDEEEE